MSSGTISFIAWAVAMFGILAVLVYVARHGSHSRSIEREMEDVASTCLPEIGKIAAKKHHQRFGRAATDAPGDNESWYPEVKKKHVKASG